MGKIRYGTSAGWCTAGANHGVPGDDERERAEWQFDTYPGTTVLRQFFSGPMPLTVPAGRAIAELLSRAEVETCEVVLSHVGNPGDNVMTLTGTLLEAGVPRVTLLGRHEPYEKVSPAQFEAEIVGMSQQVPSDLLGDRVHVGPCWILYRDRVGNPNDRARFATPAVLNASTIQVWDCYPSNPDDLGTAGGPANPKSYEPADEFLRLPYETATRDGHLLGIGEYNYKRLTDGTPDPTGVGRAQHAADVYQFAAAAGALFVAQFHYNHGSLYHPTSAAGVKVEAAVWRQVVNSVAAIRGGYASGVIDGDGGQFEQGQRYAIGRARQAAAASAAELDTTLAGLAP